MLEGTVKKAKAATKRWWKWILGGVIALLLIFVAWKLRRQAQKIVELEAEKHLAEEKTKNMELLAREEKDSAVAEALQQEAIRLRAGVDTRQKEIDAARKVTENLQRAVDTAKSWQELRKKAQDG